LAVRVTKVMATQKADKKAAKPADAKAIVVSK
jgi:hypothetical protein